MFNRKGDLEQKPAKNDEAEGQSSEHRSGLDLAKTWKQAGDAIGKVQNDVLERLTNAHVKQQYVASISPALANQYVRGRDVMLSRSESKKSTTDLSDLSAAERQAVQTYQRLHSDLPSKIPFYNKETLANDLDRDIVRKARSQPETTTEVKPNSRSITRQELKQEVKQELKPELKPTQKPEPSSKQDSKPATKAELRPDIRPESRQNSKAVYKDSLSSSSGNQSEVAKAIVEKAQSQIFQRQIEQKYTPNGIASEKTLSDLADHRAAASAHHTGETAKLVPGNALLTSLEKNRNKIQRSERAIDTKGAPSESIYKNSKSDLRPDYTSDIKSELKSEFKPKFKPDLESKLKPDSNKTSCSDKHETISERREEKKLLSSSVQSTAPSVRLIPVSQSNIAMAYRDGAINVVRQLSDRTACSTIKVFVTPTTQISTKSDIKLDVLTTAKQIQPHALGNLAEGNLAEGKTNRKPDIAPASKAEFKQNFNQDFKPEFKPDTKAAPKPESRNDPKPDFKPDSKPYSKLDSKPHSGSTSSDASSSKARYQEFGNRTNLEVSQETFVDCQGKVLRGYRLKCQDADLKYITGPEIALSAIIALASIARLRTDQSMWQTDSTALVQSNVSQNYGNVSQNYGDEIYDTEAFDSNSLLVFNVTTAGSDSAMSSTLIATENGTKNRKNDTETSKSVLIRPKILIGTNDSLVSIAEQLFNDGGIAWLILKLNQDLRPMLIEGKTVVRLLSRQEILIPVYQDIIDFQKSRTKEMSSNNLITVVEENQIDREIVDLAIAPMLGHNSSNVDPLQFLQSLPSLQIEEERKEDV